MKRVRTAHSDYLIDEEAGTLQRVPREDEANTLRCDNDVIELLEILTLKEGVRAEFFVQLPGNPAVTYRHTTVVEEIIDEC